jgi:hypothetical protein
VRPGAARDGARDRLRALGGHGARQEAAVSLDAFWRGYDATLARVREERPATLAALATILNAFQPPSSGTCFFGNNADETIGGALSDAGWDIYYQAEYLWEAHNDASGEWIHYVEGDIYPGRWKAPT